MKKTLKNTKKLLKKHKKTLKKHKKKQKYKQFKGGDKTEIIYSSNNMDDIIYYIKNISIDKQINYEICGTIIENNNYELVLHTSNMLSKSNRNLCNYIYYDNVIWHTHPDKFYPSVEDIMKIIKHPTIQVSFIITNEGYWILYRLNDNKYNDINNKNIDYINNKLYFKTKKGRKYNEEAVNNYVTSINKLLHNILYIEFLPW